MDRGQAPGRDQSTLSIVIVSYNIGDLLPDCLDSILAQQDLEPQIIVVDNASVDGTVDLVRQRYPMVLCFGNQDNRGFAAANNQALQACTGDYVFLLNPDTRLRPGCLATMLQYMEGHPEVGLAGPALLDRFGAPHPSAESSYPGQRYTRGELRNLPGEIAWLLGAALIAPRGLLTELAGFDEQFFLYGEDLDLSLRVRQAGFKLGYIEQAEVIHLEGQSERGAVSSELFTRKYLAEWRFMAKHYRSETLRAIVRARSLQARLRILTLSLAHLFGMTRSAQGATKLEQYRIVRRLLTQDLVPEQL